MAKYSHAGNLLQRAKNLYRTKGLSSLIRGGIRKLFYLLIGKPLLRSFCVLYYRNFKSSSFSFNGKNYKYFYHWYNTTWKNERAVEIPIVREVINEYKDKKILEAGNVLSHYAPVKHDILDKYERAESIINKDIVDFQPFVRYDLIVSISTIEHVGWDEEPRNPIKVLEAIENLRGILASKGKIVVTFPIGSNPVLDEYVKKGTIKFFRQYHLMRISKDNRWKEVKWENIQSARMNEPFPGVNGLVVGIIEKK